MGRYRPRRGDAWQLQLLLLVLACALIGLSSCAFVVGSAIRWVRAA
jgi:hypothetical protein